MARTGFFHHIGTFLLFAATVLLIVTCISAPVVHDLSLMKVELGGGTSGSDANVALGTFGWCDNNINSHGDDVCSKSQVGYSISSIPALNFIHLSSAAEDTVRGLTKAMILHPIACGLNFIAFLLALGAGVVGSFLASAVALLAFLVTLVIMIIDFVMFAIVRSNINDSGTNATAQYGAAAWTILVSAICSLFGTLVVFFTCCSGRIHKKRQTVPVKSDYGVAPATRRRRWF
ncbi:actin cortical patch SUR7/pH-response regulator pali [Cercophora scortea]|uniref:Actin cortical patch SUR7/pH-response regulator pali n=1 Tax=Cercophora scortea TaxID=314031 RepID=A0AAE0MCU8_9PEZI|nr:actin cortical patch SUR7/pH-response regulator pali [Cercophora scortea]